MANAKTESTVLFTGYLLIGLGAMAYIPGLVGVFVSGGQPQGILDAAAPLLIGGFVLMGADHARRGRDA